MDELLRVASAHPSTPYNRSIFCIESSSGTRNMFVRRVMTENPD